MLDEVAAEPPTKRPALDGVPVPDVGHHASDEVHRRRERAVTEHLALQDAEPDFDLVDPRSVERRVDEANPAAVTLAEGVDERALVHIEVVANDDDLAGGVVRHELFEERDEALRRARHAPAEDLARLHVERRDQIRRAVSYVLGLPAQAALATGGHVERVEIFARRHAGLLVDAEHPHARRRRDVEIANRTSLRAEVGIGAVQPRLHAMGPQATAQKDPTDLAAAQRRAGLSLQLLLQRLVRPHRGEVGCASCTHAVGLRARKRCLGGQHRAVRLLGRTRGLPLLGPRLLHRVAIAALSRQRLAFQEPLRPRPSASSRRPPLPGGASHGTGQVLFTSGSSGRRVFTPVAGRFTDLFYPSASRSWTGALMPLPRRFHSSRSDTSPRLAKYALRSARSTAARWLVAQMDNRPS